MNLTYPLRLKVPHGHPDAYARAVKWIEECPGATFEGRFGITYLNGVTYIPTIGFKTDEDRLMFDVCPYLSRTSMMSIKAFGDNTLYVTFPLNFHYESIVPPEVDLWLTEHNIDDWGTINNAKVGVFLTGQDAVAFRLRFSV